MVGKIHKTVHARAVHRAAVGRSDRGNESASVASEESIPGEPANGVAKAYCAGRFVEAVAMFQHSRAVCGQPEGQRKDRCEEPPRRCAGQGHAHWITLRARPSCRNASANRNRGLQTALPNEFELSHAKRIRAHKISD